MGFAGGALRLGCLCRAYLGALTAVAAGAVVLPAGGVIRALRLAAGTSAVGGVFGPYGGLIGPGVALSGIAQTASPFTAR